MHRQRRTYNLVESDENLYEIDILWEWWHWLTSENSRNSRKFVCWRRDSASERVTLWQIQGCFMVRTWKVTVEDRNEISTLWPSRIEAQHLPPFWHISVSIFHSLSQSESLLVFGIKFIFLPGKNSSDALILSLLRSNSINFDSSNTV